jgi:hypothetical protein
MPRGIPKKKWKIGDLFVVQTSDDKFVLGQIVGREASAMNSISAAFFDRRIDSPEEAVGAARSVSANDAFAILFVTRDLLDSGKWQLVGYLEPIVPPAMLPYENLREKRFIGAKIIGSGIVNKFLDAFYALRPWDAWHNPNYLDGLLVSPAKKPTNLIYK